MHMIVNKTMRGGRGRRSLDDDGEFDEDRKSKHDQLMRKKKKKTSIKMMMKNPFFFSFLCFFFLVQNNIIKTEAKRGDPDKPKYLPTTIYYSIRQAQQMCDMPLPKGHENDGAPLLPKARVQGRVDQRALHLCQQWNFVVANRQAQGKMQGYKLKPIIPPEHFHDGYVQDMNVAQYPEASQAQNRLGYASSDEYDPEHMEMSREIHDNSEHVGTQGPNNAAAFADDVLLVAGAILFGAALKHVYDSRADPFKPMANVPKFPLRLDPESGEQQPSAAAANAGKHDPRGWERQG